MTKSRQQLVNRALRKLGALPAGQAAAAEDYQPVNSTVESVFADLASRGIYQWGDPDQIDEDAFEHLAEVLAQANSRDFGLDADEAMRLSAERRLKQLAPVILSGKPLRTEYF